MRGWRKNCGSHLKISPGCRCACMGRAFSSACGRARFRSVRKWSPARRAIWRRHPTRGSSVVVRSGIPLVQAGDTVEKGQLLVSGTVPITDDGGEEISSYRVRADADIYGIRERVVRKELPLWREMRTEQERNITGALEAGTHTFYWKIPEFYDMIEHTFRGGAVGLFQASRRMKPAWTTIRTEYRKLRLRLIFICRFLSGGVSTGRRLSAKKGIQNQSLRRCQRHFKRRRKKN